MNTISDLWGGRSGLARTYWLWGVLSGIPWGIALSLVTPGSAPAILAVLALVVYYVMVHVGIWRAASQYQGAKVWAILAKIAVLITPVCLVLGTMLAVALPAYQDYKKRSSIGSSTSPKSSEEYGFGISSRTEYEGTVAKYREQIKSGEIHVFDSTPTMYLKEGDKEWPEEEVLKIGFLWWYEDDYIYMIISNTHQRIPIRKIILGANHGACGTTGQTSYPVDLNIDIQPAHFAALRLSNDLLFKFAYQLSGKLNDEEQKRWSSGRTDRNDCFDILNAWFSGF